MWGYDEERVIYGKLKRVEGVCFVLGGVFV